MVTQSPRHPSSQVPLRGTAGAESISTFKKGDRCVVYDSRDATQIILCGHACPPILSAGFCRRLDEPTQRSILSYNRSLVSSQRGLKPVATF
jgi:hypothetical protein